MAWADEFSCKMSHFWLDNVQTSAWISGLGGPFCLKKWKNDFCWAWEKTFLFEKMKKWFLLGMEHFFSPILRPKASVPLWDLFIGQGLGPWLGLDLWIPIHPNLNPLWNWMCLCRPLKNVKPTFLDPGESPFWFLNFWIRLNEKIPPKNPTNIWDAIWNDGCPRDKCYPCQPLPERRNSPIFLKKCFLSIAKHTIHSFLFGS